MISGDVVIFLLYVMLVDLVCLYIGVFVDIILLQYYVQMLIDEYCMMLFWDVIVVVVCFGMYVFELGVGIGVMLFFVVQQGVKVIVVECELGVFVVVCVVLVRNIGDVVILVYGDVCDFLFDILVDVVICEMMYVGQF